MPLDFQIDGLADLKAKLLSAVQKLPDAVASETYQFGEEIMTDSKEVAPVDTGALMNTGHVQLPKIDGGKVSVTLGYGDESVGYALSVHENLNPNVHWKKPGSGPKYLENPFEARKGELAPRVAEVVRNVLLED